MFFAVNVYFRPGIFPEKHAVVGLNVQRRDFAVLVYFSLTDSNHSTFLRFLFRGVGNNYPALAFLLLLDRFYNNPLLLRPTLHCLPPFFFDLINLFLMDLTSTVPE